MSNEPKKTRAPRALRLTVPESLAREIRRLAEVSRRPVQEVATAVLGTEVFGDVTVDRVRDLWLKHLQAEVSGSAGEGKHFADVEDTLESEELTGK